MHPHSCRRSVHPSPGHCTEVVNLRESRGGHRRRFEPTRTCRQRDPRQEAGLAPCSCLLDLTGRLPRAPLLFVGVFPRRHTGNDFIGVKDGRRVYCGLRPRRDTEGRVSADTGGASQAEVGQRRRDPGDGGERPTTGNPHCTSPERTGFVFRVSPRIDDRDVGQGRTRARRPVFHLHRPLVPFLLPTDSSSPRHPLVTYNKTHTSRPPRDPHSVPSPTPMVSPTASPTTLEPFPPSTTETRDSPGPDDTTLCLVCRVSFPADKRGSRPRVLRLYFLWRPVRRRSQRALLGGRRRSRTRGPAGTRGHGGASEKEGQTLEKDGSRTFQ